ncbi:hypothetical protein [Marinobacter sp. es.042]|uniref:hypothetical protein n=1 Tax=Marinobacter sp. es.042 TaxID=1761794 RepID=UPI00156000AA|nr:hypothetical protein [Marinobacter sp. es.042]
MWCYGSAGSVCILFLALVFYRLTRPVSASKRQQGSEAQSGSSIDAIRNLIKPNPLEAALMAFAVGIAEQKDPSLKLLLLEGGMVLMKGAESSDPDRVDEEKTPENESETQPDSNTPR